MIQSSHKHSDLFLTTLHDLHSEAPKEMLNSLREHLQRVKQRNPNSARTAEACLAGIQSDSSTLLHVLTAAYLINGGVMLKHTGGEAEDRADQDPVNQRLEEAPLKEMTLTELEEELRSFGLTEDQTLHAAASPPHPAQPFAEPSLPGGGTAWDLH